MPREYTPQQKEAILAEFAGRVASGMSRSEAAKSLGVPYRTIQRWMREVQGEPPFPPADLTELGREIGFRLLRELSTIDRGDFKGARTLLTLAQAYSSLVKTLMEIQAFSANGGRTTTEAIMEIVEVRKKLEALYGGQ